MHITICVQKGQVLLEKEVDWDTAQIFISIFAPLPGAQKRKEAKAWGSSREISIISEGIMVIRPRATRRFTHGHKIHLPRPTGLRPKLRIESQKRTKPRNI